MNRQDAVVAQAVGILRIVLESGNLSGAPIQAVDAALVCCDPHHPLPVLVQREDIILAQAVRVALLVAIIQEAFGPGLETADAAQGSDPQLSRAIEAKRRDEIVAQACCIGGVVDIPFGEYLLPAVRLPTRQPASESTYPERAGAV